MTVNHIKVYEDEVGKKVFQEYKNLPHAKFIDDVDAYVVFFTISYKDAIALDKDDTCLKKN